MSQLIIVQGGDAPIRRRIFDRLLGILERRSGRTASDRRNGARSSAAVLPPLLGEAPCLLDSGETGAWTCAAGMWFYDGETGAPALNRIRADLAGGGSLPGVDGMFVVVCGDDSSGEMEVVTDRLGTLHVYLAETEGCAVLCTSSLALAELLQPAWDPIGCREFLAMGTIFESRTLFQSIAKLPPASRFRFRDGKPVGRTTYWDVASVMYDRAPFRGDAPQLADALEAAVRMIVKRYPRCVVDLTGGYDSRAVFGAMLRTGSPFSTVVNGPADSPDVAAANRIAARYGIPHSHNAPAPLTAERQFERIRAALPLCDGEYDLLLYGPVMDIHSNLARRFECSIGGSNGEIAKGYWWELLGPFAGRKSRFDARRVAQLRFVYEGEQEHLLASKGEPLADHFAGVIQRANAPLAGMPDTAMMDNVYLTLRMQRWQGRIASATSRIWPCCSPFTFRGPMEVALSAPPPTRKRYRLSRRLIEQFDPKLAALPLAQGYPASPIRLSNLHRFWPMAVEVWNAAAARLRRSGGPSRPDYLELLSYEGFRELLRPESMASADLFLSEGLRRVVSRAHNGTLRGSRFGRLATLELVARAVRHGGAQ